MRVTIAYVCLCNSYAERSTSERRRRLSSYVNCLARARYDDDERAIADARGKDQYFREDVQSPQPPTFNGVRGQVNTYRSACVVKCKIVCVLAVESAVCVIHMQCICLM